MPRTRYLGSKYRFTSWILRNLNEVEFDSVLDAFGGSGAVSYALKLAGKSVTYNDLLAFNGWIGTALVENHGLTISDLALDRILHPVAQRLYADFIADTFDGIYFTTEENRWLDIVVQNLESLPCRHTRALGYFALFQSALAKRPYNLFHRKNLYMRTADVPRGFGNKAGWDRPFEEHFHRFLAQLDKCLFDSGLPCRAMQGDAEEVVGDFDLVYIDPPYINSRGVGVDYFGFYHFLEGLVDYGSWPSRIDWSTKHRRLQGRPSPWTDPKRIHESFRRLFERFRRSVLVVSYRSDGIPAVEELVSLLREFKPKVAVDFFQSRPYALSTNTRSREVVMVASD